LFALIWWWKGGGAREGFSSPPPRTKEGRRIHKHGEHREPMLKLDEGDEWLGKCTNISQSKFLSFPHQRESISQRVLNVIMGFVVAMLGIKNP